MRISTKKTDLGYHPLAHLAKVFLDDQELRYCVTADEEKGEAVVEKDWSGNPLDDLLIHGRIRVEMPSKEHADEFVAMKMLSRFKELRRTWPDKQVDIEFMLGLLEVARETDSTAAALKEARRLLDRYRGLPAGSWPTFVAERFEVDAEWEKFFEKYQDVR